MPVVLAAGQLLATGNGQAVVTVAVDGASRPVPVTVSGVVDRPAINFNSQVLPIKTHPQWGYDLERLPDGDAIIARFRECKQLASIFGVRLSFHPDQYIVLNSPDERIAAGSIRDFVSQTDLLDAMRRVKDKEGIPVTTQIEIAVREWLIKRGALSKTERKRAVTRKRP